MDKKILLSGVLVAVAFSFLSPDASACSAGLCREGFTLPKAGDVPASLPAWLWIPKTQNPATPPAPGDITLTQSTAAGELPVPITIEPIPNNTTQYLVKPVNALAANADYILRSKDGCDANAPPLESTFHTTDPAPLPTTLGTLFLTDGGFHSLEVATDAGTCSMIIDSVTSDLTLTLSAEAAPWANVLAYETIVSGERWSPTHGLQDQLPPGESWAGRSKDTFFAACGRSDQGAGLMQHSSYTTTVRATLPGTTLTVETDPASLMMSCPGIDYVDDPNTSTTGCMLPSSPPTHASHASLTLFALAALALRFRAKR